MPRKYYENRNGDRERVYDIKVPRGTIVKIHNTPFTLSKSLYIHVDEERDDFKIADHNVVVNQL